VNIHSDMIPVSVASSDASRCLAMYLVELTVLDGCRRCEFHGCKDDCCSAFSNDKSFCSYTREAII